MPDRTVPSAHTPVHAERRGPGYWRVTFDSPPFNLYDPELEVSLAAVLDQVEADPDAKVVVFDSAVPEFFMAHLNLGRIGEFGEGMPTWFDIVARLARAPFISVGSVRGRARGIGNEFLMALDVRFASREKAVLGQLEIGSGIIPGCGGMQRLWRLTGKARALEIIASGEDYSADVAERYGWINRAVPDEELDAFVERFASRIASFDAVALRAAKGILEEEVAPPSAQSLASTYERFTRLLARPSVQEWLQRSGKASPDAIFDLELNMGERIGPRT